MPVLLFAEDDANWSIFFRAEFQKLAPHWEMVCVAEGLSAQAYLEHSPRPLALVTDLQMPYFSGLELIEWIKEQPQFHVLPIVVLSNSEDPSHRQRCVTLGVDSFLDKPRSLKELRSNIHDILKLCEESRSRA